MKRNWDRKESDDAEGWRRRRNRDIGSVLIYRIQATFLYLSAFHISNYCNKYRQESTGISSVDLNKILKVTRNEATGTLVSLYLNQMEEFSAKSKSIWLEKSKSHLVVGRLFYTRGTHSISDKSVESAAE